MELQCRKIFSFLGTRANADGAGRKRCNDNDEIKPFCDKLTVKILFEFRDVMFPLSLILSSDVVVYRSVCGDNGYMVDRGLCLVSADWFGLDLHYEVTDIES